MNQQQTLFNSHTYSKTLLAVLMLFSFGCSSISPLSDVLVDNRTPPQISKTVSPNTTEIKTEKSAPAYTAHVAFAGGGWRAHTGHSAWTMSLLDNGNKTLSDVFKNIDTISSNSGGSWFNTMLAYSNDFVSAIENKNAMSTWADSSSNATGWLGQQQYLFDQAPCHYIPIGWAFLACVVDHYTGSVSKALHWDNLVEQIVFRSHAINMPLNARRQAWAQDKSLLLAATMLTNEVVLSQVGFFIEKQYYQACISPSRPVLHGNKGSSCSNTEKPLADITPVTFTSLPNGSGLKPHPFLPAIGTSANFNLGYTENALFNAPKSYTTLSNPLTTDNVPVMKAAAASSAATGFAASAVIIDDWEAAYKARHEALSFQLTDGKVMPVDSDGLKANELAAAKIVKIADGGAGDNSAVNQLVSFLQQNNQADGFNIVAFDNVQEIYSPSSNGGKSDAADVGIDFANLFGQGLKKGGKTCMGPVCIQLPNVKIFDVTALNQTPVTWTAVASSNDPAKKVFHKLIYTKYTVSTVDNSTYGIKAGTTGTLHAFTAAWSDAGTAPESNKDKDFKAYAAMLKFMNYGLKQTYKATGKTGIDHLNEAFGIK